MLKKIGFSILSLFLFCNFAISQQDISGQNMNSVLKKVKTSTGEEKTIELQPIVMGHANLYYSKEDKGIVFYAQKDKGDIREINKDKFNGFLQVFFSDCNKEYFKDMKEKEMFYDKLTFSRLFSKYNKCIDPDYDLVKPQGFPRVSHGAKVGINVSDLSNYPFNIFYEVDLDRKIRMTGGYFIEVAYTDFIAIYTELSYVEKGAINKDSLVDFSSSNLQLPVFAKFTFMGRKKISPYILGGFKFNFGLDRRAYKIEDGIRRPLDYKEQFINFCGGVGAEVEINSKNSLIAEARFDYIKYNVNTVFELKNMNLAFLVGLKF